MSYFIQVKEYDMNMHAKIQCMNKHGFFVNNFFKFCILGILYNAIMHQCRFGQAY
jgi:hypothetical protein